MEVKVLQEGKNFRIYLTIASPACFCGDIVRSYDSCFELQCRLLDAFPVEAGRGLHPRIIPPLPGKASLFHSRRKKMSLSDDRRAGIEHYVTSLILLPPHIAQCPLVTQFLDLSSEQLAPSYLFAHVDEPRPLRPSYVLYSGPFVRGNGTKLVLVSPRGRELLLFNGAFGSNLRHKLLGSFSMSSSCVISTKSVPDNLYDSGVQSTLELRVDDACHFFYLNTCELAHVWQRALELLSSGGDDVSSMSLASSSQHTRDVPVSASAADSSVAVEVGALLGPLPDFVEAESLST